MSKILVISALCGLFPVAALAVHDDSGELQRWRWNNTNAPQDRVDFFLTVERNGNSTPEETRFKVHGMRMDLEGRIKPVAGDVLAFRNGTQLWRMFTTVGAWDVASEWDPATQAFGTHDGTWVTKGFSKGGHRSFFRGFEFDRFIQPEQTGIVKRFRLGCQWPPDQLVD